MLLETFKPLEVGLLFLRSTTLAQIYVSSELDFLKVYREFLGLHGLVWHALCNVGVCLCTSCPTILFEINPLKCRTIKGIRIISELIVLKFKELQCSFLFSF